MAGTRRIGLLHSVQDFGAALPKASGRWLVAVQQSRRYFLPGANAALFVIGMFIKTSAELN